MEKSEFENLRDFLRTANLVEEYKKLASMDFQDTLVITFYILVEKLKDNHQVLFENIETLKFTLKDVKSDLDKKHLLIENFKKVLIY